VVQLDGAMPIGSRRGCGEFAQENRGGLADLVATRWPPKA